MCWEYNGEQKQMGSLHHGTDSLMGETDIKCINSDSPDIAATLMQTKKENKITA